MGSTSSTAHRLEISRALYLMTSDKKLYANLSVISRDDRDDREDGDDRDGRDERDDNETRVSTF